MKLVADFQNAIQRDLAWRKREISAIRSDAAKPEITAGYLFRFGQILICAHWEGFLKKSAQLYIEHIFLQDQILKEFLPNIVAIKFFETVMRTSSSKYAGSDDHIRLAKLILEAVDSKIDRPGWSPQTEGNPGSEVLERILKTIGVHPQLEMDQAAWATTKVFINEHLVRDRHQIAHGEGTPISKIVFLERSERLLNLLDLLSAKILDAAQRRSYHAA